MSSLFSQVGILLGGKVISSSTNTYHYRAYIETLLNYSKEAKKLGMGLFYKDTTGHFDEMDPTSDNTGLNKNMNFENSVKLCSYKEECNLTFLTRVNCY